MRYLLITFSLLLYLPTTYAQIYTSQFPELHSFLKEVSSLLPQSFIQKVKGPITIEVAPLNKNLNELPENKCQSRQNWIYATVNPLRPHTIVIEKALIKEILKGPDSSFHFDCGHGSYYQTALATVLHETAHLYDLSSEHLGLGKKLVSDRLDFYKLSNWKRNWLHQKTAKNLSQKRSLDPYEFKNLQEHFAVNFEFFILDPNYKCKRPSYYRYFSQKLNHSPFSNYDCRINSQIRLDDTHALIDISPERVWRIDYLLASKGDEMVSGFGHSMYRLIVCAPFRKKASEDCLRDKLYHVVLSYRANVTDIKSNPFKGLVGKYDSVLFMLSFPKVVEEYNMGELRDLFSLPLELNPEQKTKFIEKALEIYWEYSGSYKFVTQNCATESTDLIQSALNDLPIIKENILTPYSLMNILIKHHLAPGDLFENRDQARQKGFLFESDAKLLSIIKKAFWGSEDQDFDIKKVPIFAKSGPPQYAIVKKEKHIKEILQAFPIERFSEKLEELKQDEISLELKRKLNDLSIISQAVLNVRQHDLDEEIGNYLEKLENDPGNLGIAIRNWNNKRKHFRINTLRTDYGIPLEINDEEFERYKSSIEELEKSENNLVEDVKQKYESKVDELTELVKIIEKIRNQSKIVGMKLYLKD